jgi:excisionase family DNA binding protein
MNNEEKISLDKKKRFSLEKQPLTLTEAAKELGVHKSTLRRALESGSLKAFRFGPKGHFRIMADELERFIRHEL